MTENIVIRADMLVGKNMRALEWNPETDMFYIRRRPKAPLASVGNNFASAYQAYFSAVRRPIPCPDKRMHGRMPTYSSDRLFGEMCDTFVKFCLAGDMNKEMLRRFYLEDPRVYDHAQELQRIADRSARNRTSIEIVGSIVTAITSLKIHTIQAEGAMNNALYGLF